MNLGAKIIVAAVNFVCLFVTLIYPNNATPISLLPCWINVGTWLYIRLSTQRSVLNTSSFKIYVAALSILIFFASICMCVGLGFVYCENEELVRVEDTDPSIKENEESVKNLSTGEEINPEIKKNEKKISSTQTIKKAYFIAHNNAILPVHNLIINYRLFQVLVIITYLGFAVAEIILTDQYSTNKSPKSPNEKIDDI